MSWWPWTHQHDLVLEASVYAPPAVTEASELVFIDGDTARERALHGCTSFVWKCSEPGCDYVKTVVTLGKRNG